MQIETSQLILRDFCTADLSAYCALRQDDKFLRFYEEEAGTDDYSAMLLQMFMEQAAATPRCKFQLAIIEKSSARLIGSCGLRIEAPGVASVGCELGRDWHHSGYAREAAAAMLDVGFGTLGLQRIYAETNARNLAAIRLCRTLGFSQSEVHQQAKFFKGQCWDILILTLPAAKWLQQQRS